MPIVANALIAIVCLIHVYIFLLETVLFRSRGRKVFGLKQDQVEARLVRAVQLDSRIELRGRHELIGLEPGLTGVTLTVRTPDGLFDMRADWVVACDGARSEVRQAYASYRTIYDIARHYRDEVVPVRKQIADNQRFIETKHTEQQEILDRFATNIKRFRELKGLPVDAPAHCAACS